MMRTIEERFDPWPQAGERVLCALSGGLDSMCLLHLLKERPGIQVRAAHFHHGLRAAADRDEEFVREICARWGVPLTVGRGDAAGQAREAGQSPEEAGRTLRYAFLERTARETDCTAVYTAHHAGDNAETVLWNLIRGTGLQGLTGIPRRRGLLRRPLLDVTRAELQEYAAAHGIPHVEDETNADPAAASRNFLRLRVLPLLEELNPRAVEHIAGTAAILRRESEALEALAEMEAASAVRRPGGSWAISASVLEDWPRASSERAVLQLMARTCGHRRDFTARHVCAVLELKAGGSLSLPHGLLVRREGDSLCFERTAPLPPAQTARVGQPVAFGAWTVTLGAEAGEGVSCRLSQPEGLALTVTSWRGGDRLTLPGQRGPRSLKRLCAERGIPPWERDRLPVLRAGERPAAVPGIGVEQSFAPRPGEAGFWVTFRKEREEE